MSRPSLLDLHTGCANLAYAVQLALEPLNVDIRVQWRSGVGLSVEIETSERRKQRVVDALKHGALHGPYDYRFSVSYPTMPAEPDDRVWVSAYPKDPRDVGRR